MTEVRKARLFAYGSLLEGERDHSLLEGATKLGPATTKAAYRLVDLGPYAALIPGQYAIEGELYEVDLEMRGRIDVVKEHPVLFQRQRVDLADGTEADAYLMKSNAVVGKKRLHVTSWRRRFEPRRTPGAGPFVQWARGRRR